VTLKGSGHVMHLMNAYTIIIIITLAEMKHKAT